MPGAMLFLQHGDLANTEWMTHLLYELKPDEVYHLGAQSHVRVSFDIPEYTADVTGLGTTRILDAIRRSGVKTRFYQASSSEMFGAAPPPQDENSPFVPRSPYAVAKVYAYWMTRIHREAYGAFACNGILFNHESPRRGETFVTRKITRGLWLIRAGKQPKLYLGNMDAKRDWGYAPEYVEGMWRMLQQEKADDYVLGTGEMHSVREFVEEAFGYVGLDWKAHVEIDSYYYRPLEVDQLQAAFSSQLSALSFQLSAFSYQLLPAAGGGPVAGRRVQGPPPARLGDARQVQGTGPHHGGCRLGGDGPAVAGEGEAGAEGEV